MGEKWKQWQVLFWGGSRITVDSDCSHEIKRHLLLGRKAMTNLDRVLKSRDITLPSMVCILKAIVFPVVMYRCESWTIKKANRQRIDAFQLWCWRKLLTRTCSWTAWRSNQSIWKKINPEYSLERLMLKLQLQYSGHLIRTATAAANALQSCPTLFGSLDHSMPGFPVFHYLLEFAQTHVHWVGDAIRPSHPPSSPTPPALNLFQHQGLFQ